MKEQYLNSVPSQFHYIKPKLFWYKHNYSQNPTERLYIYHNTKSCLDQTFFQMKNPL